MLAKVLKSDEAAVVEPFYLATRTAAGEERSVNAFVVPEFDGTLLEPEAQPEESEIELSDEEIVETATSEAARIIAQAEEQAEIIRQVAAEKAEHESAAKFENEVSARVAEMRESLTATIDEVSGLKAAIAAEAEIEIVELAIEIAKKIVGHEVAVDREVALSLVRSSLARLHDRSFAEVHLHPDDLDFVEQHREKLSFRGTLQLSRDASISPGGCLIHTETGDIDARIESQFDEIAHGLFT